MTQHRKARKASLHMSERTQIDNWKVSNTLLS